MSVWRCVVASSLMLLLASRERAETSVWTAEVRHEVELQASIMGELWSGSFPPPWSARVVELMPAELDGQPPEELLAVIAAPVPESHTMLAVIPFQLDPAGRPVALDLLESFGSADDPVVLDVDHDGRDEIIAARWDPQGHLSDCG